MRCPNCKSRIKRGEDICPICDYQINKYTKQSGVDDSIADGYKVGRVRTASEVEFSRQFKQTKPRHSDETAAERYSCRGHSNENKSDKESAESFNFIKYLVISILIIVFGSNPLGLVCLVLAINAKQSSERGDYRTVSNSRKAFKVVATISVLILIVIFAFSFIVLILCKYEEN